MIRRPTAALAAGSMFLAGLTGCGVIGGGGDGGRASSQCRASGIAGQCALDLDLPGGGNHDYVVSRRFLPVLGGGVQVNAYVQTTAAVRVSWRDTAGKDVATVVEPGKPQSLRGVVSVQEQGNEQRFVVHFQRPGPTAGMIQATITYG